MATRAHIAKINSYNDQRGYYIYNHMDGYLEHLGDILFENYNTPELVDMLLSKGDASFIDATIESSDFVNGDEKRSINNLDQLIDISRDLFIEFTYVYFTDEKEWYLLSKNGRLDKLCKLLSH